MKDEKEAGLPLGEPPKKRMAHAAAILGCTLVGYGGIYGEENSVLDDFFTFDFELMKFIKTKALYNHKKNTK